MRVRSWLVHQPPSRSFKTVVQPPVPFASQQSKFKKRVSARDLLKWVYYSQVGVNLLKVARMWLQPRYSNLIVALPQLPCHLCQQDTCLPPPPLHTLCPPATLLWGTLYSPKADHIASFFILCRLLNYFAYLLSACSFAWTKLLVFCTNSVSSSGL